MKLYCFACASYSCLSSHMQAVLIGIIFWFGHLIVLCHGNANKHLFISMHADGKYNNRSIIHMQPRRKILANRRGHCQSGRKQDRLLASRWPTLSASHCSAAYVEDWSANCSVMSGYFDGEMSAGYRSCPITDSQHVILTRSRLLAIRGCVVISQTCRLKREK